MDNRNSLILAKLNEALKDKGFSKRALARKLRVHYGSVHPYFQENHNFTLKTLRALEKALDITLFQIPDKNEEDTTLFPTTGTSPDIV